MRISLISLEGRLDIPNATLNDLVSEGVTILGIPLDENSSFHRGSALAPAAIRMVLNSSVGNWCCETGADLSMDSRWVDAGDLDLTGIRGEAAFSKISEAVDRILSVKARPLVLGGDHSITYPVVRSMAGAHPPLNVLHLDAHPDLYENFEDNPLSHASPFARIMEAGLAARLVQVGIRTSTPHQRAQAERYGVESIEMRAWSQRPTIYFEGPVYLSLDLDVFDPAFAPGVSHHEPGGLSTRQVVDFLHELDCEWVGADIVEFNPSRDPGGITAALGAKLCKEILSLLLERLKDS